MKNNVTRTIRSEEITIDVRICAALAANRGGEVYLVAIAPDILTHEKSSLAPPGVSLAFSLGDEGGFRWVGEYDITADEMLSGIEPQRETKTQQAKDLICALLAGGKQVLSEDIDKAALERGIPGRTVRDAKRELGDALKSKIVEGRKKVFWME